MSGGIKRRIVRREGVGRDGANLDDLGRGPEEIKLKAELDEITYEKLQSIADEAKEISFDHPFRGVYKARIESISFDATEKSEFDVDINILIEGFVSKTSASTSTSATSAASQAQSSAQNVYDSLDDWLTNPHTPDDFTNKANNYTDAFNDFDDHLDLINNGDSTNQQSMGSDFAALGDASSDLMTAVDTYSDTVPIAAESTLQEDIVTNMWHCSQALSAYTAQNTQVWTNATVTSTSTSIDEIALDYIGAWDETQIENILNHNEQLVSLLCIVPGTEISIPV
jgi:hypothetical protein